MDQDDEYLACCSALGKRQKKVRVTIEDENVRSEMKKDEAHLPLSQTSTDVRKLNNKP